MHVVLVVYVGIAHAKKNALEQWFLNCGVQTPRGMSNYIKGTSKNSDINLHLI